MAREKNLPLSRLHLHPFGGYILCYDKNKWSDGYDAIVKSSLAGAKYCLSHLPQSNWADYHSNFDFEIPPTIDNVQTTADNLTYSMDLDPSTTCYLQIFMKCRTLRKTAGLGDVISGTGFIYHVP